MNKKLEQRIFSKNKSCLMVAAMQRKQHRCRRKTNTEFKIFRPLFSNLLECRPIKLRFSILFDWWQHLFMNGCSGCLFASYRHAIAAFFMFQLIFANKETKDKLKLNEKKSRQKLLFMKLKAFGQTSSLWFNIYLKLLKLKSFNWL